MCLIKPTKCQNVSHSHKKIVLKSQICGKQVQVIKPSAPATKISFANSLRCLNRCYYSNLKQTRTITNLSQLLVFASVEHLAERERFRNVQLNHKMGQRDLLPDCSKCEDLVNLWGQLKRYLANGWPSQIGDCISDKLIEGFGAGNVGCSE